MSRPRVRDDLLQNVFGNERAVFAAILAFLALLAYAILVAEFLLFVLLPLQIAAAILVLVLFYRLVLAVEHIAYED